MRWPAYQPRSLDDEQAVAKMSSFHSSCPIPCRSSSLHWKIISKSLRIFHHIYHDDFEGYVCVPTNDQQKPIDHCGGTERVFLLERIIWQSFGLILGRYQEVTGRTMGSGNLCTNVFCLAICRSSRCAAPVLVLVFVLGICLRKALHYFLRSQGPSLNDINCWIWTAQYRRH